MNTVAWTKTNVFTCLIKAATTKNPKCQIFHNITHNICNTGKDPWYLVNRYSTKEAMNKALVMNKDLIVDELVGELIGSNEDCLRKASEQIVAHVLHHITENTTGDDGQKMSDAEVHTLVKEYLTNKNNSSVPLPISKEVVRSICLSSDIDSFLSSLMILLTSRIHK